MATGEPRRRKGGSARAPEGPSDWKEEVVGASGLNVLAGSWLVLSPFAIGYESGDARWNPVVSGAIVALIGIVRAGGAYRQAWLSWLNAAVGVWLFFSAFWLAESGTASWNSGIMGVAVFLLASWAASATQERDRGGPGGAAATIDRM